VVQDQCRAPISVQYTLTHKCIGLSLNVGKNDLKVVCNGKRGVSARWQLLVLSMGHWRSRFVCYLILPSSFRQRMSFSAKNRQIIRRLAC
jgi:hypothetical protein